MDKVRMKVLEAFTRNLDGGIVSGHPKHPDSEYRFVHVSEAAAQKLEDEKLAKRYSLKDEARDEVEGEDADDDDDETAEGGDKDPANVDGASTKGTGAAASAQRVREARTDTTKTNRGGRRKKAAGKAAPAPHEAGGAPVGGNDTNASTNHPTKTTDGTGQTGETGIANEAPDAAP